MISCLVKIIGQTDGPVFETRADGLIQSFYSRVPVAGDYVEVPIGKGSVSIKLVWRVLLPTRTIKDRAARPLVLVTPD